MFYTLFDGIPAQVIRTIIGFRDDGTVNLQGDKNGFVDPYRPELSDIAAKLVFSVSTAGSIAWPSLVLIAVASLSYPMKRRPPAPAEAAESKSNGGSEVDERPAPTVLIVAALVLSATGCVVLCERIRRGQN